MTYGLAVEDDGFADWYLRERRRVAASLFALTHDRELATDAADEAFARALAAWPQVQDMTYPTAWVHRVAINVANRNRRRRRQEEQLHPKLAETTPEPDDHPELWQAVAALPPRQRTAIVLRYVADLPEEAIAEAMHISRGTVAATMAQARQRLREVLADENTIQEEAPYA
jgi:RNA polymerase sigma factor (sigma-70 family)